MDHQRRVEVPNLCSSISIATECGWGGRGVTSLGMTIQIKGHLQKITRKDEGIKRRSNALEWRCPSKTCNLCVDVAPCRHVGQDTGGFPRKGTGCRGLGGQQHLSKKQPSFPSETSWVLTDINVTKPMRHISTRCIIYIFGNQYYLLNKWATTFTGWRDFSNVPCQHTTTTTTTWRSPCAAARDAKNVHKYLVSHLNERRKKKIDCDNWKQSNEIWSVLA